MSNLLGLAGQKALVVGGGYGSGRVTARMLSEAGAAVAVADRDGDRAREVARQIGGHAICGDVTSAEGATAIVDEAAVMLGGLTRLANIVGAVELAPFDATDLALWQRQMNLNLYQQMHVCQAAGRHMRAAGQGAIALVSSVTGIYGARNQVAYGAAKAALISFVKTLADEWGPHGIRVNTVAPDNTLTSRLIDRTGKPAEQALADFDARAADDGAPLRRGGREHEIAGPLLFLLSDLSSFMTGQCLVADGGLMIHFPHPAVDAVVQAAKA